MKKSKKKILVMTSAYKRRQDDEQFNEYFVVELTKRLSARFDISVLAPSWPSARMKKFLMAFVYTAINSTFRKKPVLRIKTE